MSAAHRFNNALRYRDDFHEMQRQLTPPYVLEPVRRALGTIELDPCTEPDNPTGAQRFFTASHDGAAQPWDASAIYVNPPYSKAREKWVGRCIEAAAAGARVILLMPSHTDTRLFHRALDTASHVVFIRGRVKFGVLRNNGRQEAASHPSCLICWNLESADELAHLGRVWDLTAAAKDAEIEALRAQLDEQCRLHAIGMERELALIARAERLAEALREAYRQVRELCDCYGHVYPEASFVRYEALLRDQEEGHEQ